MDNYTLRASTKGGGSRLERFSSVELEERILRQFRRRESTVVTDDAGIVIGSVDKFDGRWIWWIEDAPR